MLVDRHGKPLTQEVRKAIGFTERTLPASHEGDAITGVSADRSSTFERTYDPLEMRRKP